MVRWAATASIVLYFIPLVVLFSAQSFRRRSPWEIALDIPFFVSIDLISVLAMTFVLHLDVATIASRVLWVVGGGAFILWKRRTAGWRWHRPELRRGQLLGVGISAAVSVYVSTTLSRTYQIWDRYWHIGLTGSLRGQKLPFANVFEPGGRLQYHFAADALAAMMQSLSFCTISSDMALAQAHDIAFGCIGATVSLLAIAFGQWRTLALALGGSAIVLHGPVLLRGEAGESAVPFHGYSYSHFLTNSFRPHVALAGVLITGFVAAVAIRLRDARAVSFPRTFAVLGATSAALTITDEASLAVLGVCLFFGWLVHEDVLVPGRARGVAALLGLAVLVVAARAVFVGLSGGPVESVAWAKDGRIPGMQGGSFTGLHTWGGLVVLICDFFPFLFANIGLLLAVATRPDRRLAAALTFSVVSMVICFVALTHVVINHAPTESMRFFIAPCFIALELAFLWLARMDQGSPARLRGEFEHTRRGAYGFNCRTIAGARLGQTPELAYVDTTAWYRYAACRPIFAPGIVKYPWHVKIAPHMQWYPNTQFADIQVTAGPDATIPLMCLTDAGESDPVCAYALANCSCTPNGTQFVRCALTPDHREKLKQRDVEHVVWR